MPSEHADSLKAGPSPSYPPNMNDTALSECAADLLVSIQHAFDMGALPGENEGFDEQACKQAARFALDAMMVRVGTEPVIAMESISGRDGKRNLRLVVVNTNKPFLVDSIAAVIASFGLAIDRIIHPVLAVRRGAKGELTDILDRNTSGERQESIVYMETERADARTRKALAKALHQALSEVYAAVDDWPLLQKMMARDAENVADAEGSALLRWFLDRQLTLLAHLEYDRNGKVHNPMGTARVSAQPLLADESFTRAFEWFDAGGATPLIIKSNRISAVHRRVPIDLIIVPVWADGKIARLSVHGGIWTSAALAASPNDVPLLRAHLKTVNNKFGFDPSGHAGKALAHALTALPHDLLIAFRLEDLERTALTSMSLADRPRPKLLTIRSALSRHLFAFVWLPRDEVSTGRRIAIETMLAKAANASVLSWSITLEDGEVALLRYMLDLRGDGQVPDGAKLDHQLAQMVRGWVPEVENALSNHGGKSRASALAARYAAAFPMGYRDNYGSDEAAIDILRLRELSGRKRRSARLYSLASDAPQVLRLKLYQVKGAIALSEAVPVLENFGFQVVEEIPTPLDNGDLGYIHDFLLTVRDAKRTGELIERADMMEAAIANVLDGRAEDDLFNQLVTMIGISEGSVILFRAWFRYLRQTGLTYGMATVVDALRDAPDVTRALIALFRAGHSPDFEGDREIAKKQAVQAIKSGLKHVSAIDDDRMLRLFQSLIQAILRTNAYAPAGYDALAFKIDSAAVPGLPKPLPWREIFVYSPSVEGVHLRAGPVARGGLRWSDRRDDFRTEILGLMKAQRVKNAVIVPTGAKGGFYPKALPDPSLDREAWAKAGQSAYKTFIRALLSITDNIVDGETVHPERVEIPDGPDPYFVVAADKGTATFSDTANMIAQERDFWLGDAFASGGSKGYDHKAMGITARGAWVSVQRHFAEMGMDVQRDTIQVAGCGDMSGDVFGNGMLLSKAIKLVAAFDHRHIFIDPDPDPAKSWKERKRLFDLPRSSWEDYNAKLISKGGGVFARSLKSIKTTPQIRALLGIEDREIEPPALISAILKAQIDLLWFGGIGTYIKAAVQNNVDVGDPANDALRVDAEDLRCRAIGEGANLGITQAARIAYAAQGGRINTDFIDNSAGVDCSDNEVNIKIALREAVHQGKLSDDERDRLLEAMTDNVSALVLEDNRLQALSLSIAESGGSAALPAQSRLIDSFEETGRLDRSVEGLAEREELHRRAQEGHGLTRPELSVLLSTAKLALQDAIEASAIPDDPSMDENLLAAFPVAMQNDHRQEILTHQLRQQIIATKLSNRMVNRLGLIHPFELVEEEGASLAHIALAFIVAERLFDMDALWHSIDTAKIDETSRLALFDKAAMALRSQIADILRVTREEEMPGDVVNRLKEPVLVLFEELEALLNNEAKQQAAELVDELVARGADRKLAEMVARLFKMDGAVGLAHLAQQSDIAPAILTRAFSNLGSDLGLDWVQMTAARMEPSDPWERLLVAGLARDFQQMRLNFLDRNAPKDPVAFVAQWTAGHAGRIAQFRNLVSRAQLAVEPSIPMLAQIASQARTILGG